jgi:translation initiation factor eIF-2B subunit delta
MPSVTKVLLGASAVKSNGAVIARAGSAMVAMAAAQAHKPVLVCAQSIKFHEDVQLDSITENERGSVQVCVLCHYDVHL